MFKKARDESLSVLVINLSQVEVHGDEAIKWATNLVSMLSSGCKV